MWVLNIRKWIRAATVILLWTGLGILSSFEMQLESTFSPRKDSLWHVLVMQVGFTTICAALTPAVLWLARRFRIDEKPYWPNALIHLLASVAFAVLTKSIWYPLMIAAEGRAFAWMKFFWSLIYSFDYCVILYWMVVLVSYAVEYYRRYQRGLVDAARLNGELAQAQLRWLKSRLQPHFLFNALNTISALVHEDPRSAERMIAQLSDLLRLSLRDSGVQEVTLRQELEYLNLYLDIERTRFADRLTVHMDIEPESEQALVPSLILQPLVENAIRHGISGRIEHGVIAVRAQREGSRLVLSVEDNGAGLQHPPVQPVKEGVGLSSARGRLERLYGRSQSLVLRNRPHGGAEARISIPFLASNPDVAEVIHETV